MKILITHELFMPDFSGGGEKLVYEMACSLQKEGHEVRVLTTGNPKLKSFEGIRTTRLKRNRYIFNFAFFEIIKAARWADIIQTSTYNACFPSWLAGKILKKPVVCLVMSYWGSRWKKMRPGVRGYFSWLFEKIVLHRSYDKMIFLSDFSLRFAKKYGLASNKVTVINPGVDISEYISLKKENFVLFCGRLVKQKGVYDLLKVAKLLPKIKFLVVGWGEEEEKMKRIASSNVIFKNFEQNERKDFLKMYSKASLFFLPSYGETFGFVLVEAMASGCTVVSTIPLGYKGKVVRVGNINGMAAEIEELMSNKDLLNKNGKQNIALAATFTWERFTKKLLNEYRNLLK